MRDVLERLRTLAEALHGFDADVCNEAADEIERLRAEVGQLQRGAFVLNVHDRIYRAGENPLIAWDSIDWQSLSAGREATHMPRRLR